MANCGSGNEVVPLSFIKQKSGRDKKRIYMYISVFYSCIYAEVYALGRLTVYKNSQNENSPKLKQKASEIGGVGV